MKPVKSLKFKIDDSPLIVTVKGREAWTLDHLMQAGDNGITPIERPAPRWSEYVRGLREKTVKIETIPEKHKGPYSGTHGRYVLRSDIEVVERVDAESQQ